MDSAEFDNQIAEIQAEHNFILSELNILKSPESRLFALEMLNSLRNRLHELGNRYREELRRRRDQNCN